MCGMIVSDLNLLMGSERSRIISIMMFISQLKAYETRRMAQPTHPSREGFRSIRFWMVLSSVSPIFILLAIRGSDFIQGYYFEILCIFLAGLANGMLVLRIKRSKQKEGPKPRHIGKTENNSYHVIMYLLAVLLPFYRQDLDVLRELLTIVAALAIVVFLFWRFNLHYINLYFAVCGYRVFTVYPPENPGLYDAKYVWILITRRTNLPSERLTAYRISDTVYLEEDQH